MTVFCFQLVHLFPASPNTLPESAKKYSPRKYPKNVSTAKKEKPASFLFLWQGSKTFIPYLRHRRLPERRMCFAIQ